MLFVGPGVVSRGREEGREGEQEGERKEESAHGWQEWCRHWKCRDDGEGLLWIGASRQDSRGVWVEGSVTKI